MLMHGIASLLAFVDLYAQNTHFCTTQEMIFSNFQPCTGAMKTGNRGSETSLASLIRRYCGSLCWSSAVDPTFGVRFSPSRISGGQTAFILRREVSRARKLGPLLAAWDGKAVNIIALRRFESSQRITVGDARRHWVRALRVG